MVIDASALVAILRGEPEAHAFNEIIEAADTCVLSLASFVEASIVLETRHGAEGVRDLDLFIDRARIELVEVDEEQGRMARDGFRSFGKGRHRAGLNYGDCFAYALARVRAEPLLFKGDDFGFTDVASVR